MKKLQTLLLAVITFYGCQEVPLEQPRENIPVTRAALSTDNTGSYYWLGEEKIPVRKMDDKFYVMYESSNESKMKAELTKVGATFGDIRENGHSQYVSIKSFDAGKFSALKTATIEGDREKIAPALSHAFYSAPYYKTDIGEGRLTNRFSIALKNEADVKLLAKLAEENSVEILGVSELDGWYELACSNLSKGNSLEMANLFYETGLFESVGYDLGARGRVESINEPLYTNGRLWHLGNNYTNPNIHINYIAARAIVPQASSSVKIAVIDSGVQYGHPDLYNVLPGWDAETQSSPNVISHSHGTQVAGFIAAIPNNGQAVAGVAYGATIYPISFTVDSNPNNNITDGAILSSAAVMVEAVNRAVSEGAKIINCSWNYPENRVANAVKSALNAGRIVVFASGNDKTAPITGDPVTSPANSDLRIIVVGAVNANGVRASFSDYGSQLDVVAPGENVTSTTTGSAYAYANGISGTSFAAPQVSAIAALILSKYPTLTQQQVEDRIKSTANRYPVWNYEYGYGLVNATEALLGSVSGPSQPVVGINETYTVPSPPAGVTFSGWTISPSGGYTVTGGTSGTSLTVKFASVGNRSVKANYTLPGNVSYPIDKNVTAVVPPAPFLRLDPYYISSTEERVFVETPLNGSEVRYEWEFNGSVSTWGGGTSELIVPYDMFSFWGNPDVLALRCRVVVGSFTSAWSYYINVYNN